MLLKLKAQSEKCKTMVKILKVLSLTLLLYTLTLTLYASPVYAASPTPCDPTIPGDCPAGLQQIEDLFGSIISVVVGLGFVAMLVLLVWAGFKYLTSGGDPKALQSARQATTWALLGLTFMIVAWLILQLIESFTGVKVTIFDIRSLCGVGGTQFCPSPPPTPVLPPPNTCANPPCPI